MYKNEELKSEFDKIAEKSIKNQIIGLIVINRASAWAVFLILSREFFITGLRVVAVSEGKDVASTIPFLLSPVKAVSVPVKIAKGAGLGAGFGTKDATLGTEAEDEQHNPYLYSDKIKQIAEDAGLGIIFSSGVNGIKSGIRGAKNFLFKSPELKGDADRALNAAINHTSAATKDRYEKYATKYANDPEYISAPDKKAFLDKKINEDSMAWARTSDARDYGRELDDQARQARKNNNFNNNHNNKNT